MKVPIDEGLIVEIGRYRENYDPLPDEYNTVAVREKDNDNNKILIDAAVARVTDERNGKVVYATVIPGYYGRYFASLGDRDAMHRSHLEVRKERGKEMIGVRYSPQAELPVRLKEGDRIYTLKHNEVIEMGKDEEVTLKISGGYRVVGRSESGRPVVDDNVVLRIRYQSR